MSDHWREWHLEITEIACLPFVLYLHDNENSALSVQYIAHRLHVRKCEMTNNNNDNNGKNKHD